MVDLRSRVVGCLQNAQLMFVLLLLSACGWFSTDNTREPTELTSIETTLQVRKVWGRSFGDGVGDAYLRLAPMIVGDKLYIADANGEIGALSLEDGELIWDVSTDVDVSAGVNGDEELLVIGTWDGQVIAVSTEDGSELWRKQLSSEVMALSQVDLGVVVARTNDSRVYGLDVGSGAVRWTTTRKSPLLLLRGESVPVIENGKAVVGFDDGKLAAISMTRGNVIWQATVDAPEGRSELERMVDIDGIIRIDDGIIYVVGFHGRLAAITLSDGSLIWDRELSSYRGLDVDQSRVYVTDEESNIWALDRRNGASLWKQDALKYRKLTAPVVIDDYIIVGDYDGYVHWIAVADGQFVARTRVDSDGIMVKPLVLDDRAFVHHDDGTIVALGISPGGTGETASMVDTTPAASMPDELE